MTRPTPWQAHGPLQVSDNGHYLEHADGSGFFWLADTAWKLVRLTPEDLDRYLCNRSAKRFNVIQSNVTSWSGQNYAGERAFVGDGPPWAAPVLNEAYWEHVDTIVHRAAEFGIYMAIFAWWGDAADRTFADPATHNEQFGQLLGARYADAPNIIWVGAGEYHKPNMWSPPVEQEHLTNLTQLVKGIRQADPHHLMTIHPLSFLSSSDEFHDADWLDFNMVQSHVYQHTIQPLVSGDWGLKPPKPTINAEPWYEGEEKLYERRAEITRHGDQVYDTGWIQRYQAYWSVFMGSFGYTYGHMNLWCMHPTPAYWEEAPGAMNALPGTLLESALDAPGSADLGHLRKLVESKPMQDRVPAPELISVNTRGTDVPLSPNLRCATSAQDGRWAWVYSTRGEVMRLRMSRLADGVASARWYNPRSGDWLEGADTAVPSGAGAPDVYFDPPGGPADGNDWVLALEVRD